MASKAAVAGDIDLLKLAVLHDPLVGAICTPEEVWQMVDEMLVAQAHWLPQYADAIPAAKARLANADGQDPRLDGRRAARGSLRRGAARASRRTLRLREREIFREAEAAAGTEASCSSLGCGRAFFARNQTVTTKRSERAKKDALANASNREDAR